ncbi:response regulator transcription factor [Paenibacillus antri]|uniref:Response regulator transcription factor n=1 Tax=Paenibacillus antri TaxID=2582848 RepID=A0A5R9GD40_9BACL|nr:response regulator transcription factor [Paenibacillus antri]TLS50563.1 response regulator transcription factor [Paenibacillus antri]
MAERTNPISEVRIVLADDHSLFREGLKRILNMEPGLRVVAECGDGEAVLGLCRELHPDVVLLDINMPIASGVEATEALYKEMPGVKVIILSIHDDESYVFETLRKGASGYLLKDMETETLIEAIRTVVAGHAYIHPRVTGKLINQIRRMTETDAELETAATSMADIGGQTVGVRFIHTDDNPLTKREAEVLRLMSEGKSNRSIGDFLFISEKTVKNHVSSILQKMHVDDRTQAVIIAIKNGWVTL